MGREGFSALGIGVIVASFQFCGICPVAKDRLKRSAREGASSVAASLSRRGKPAFSLNGFCYRQDKRASDGRVFWRCLEDGCSARMVSDGFDDTPVARGTNDHTHAPRGESGLQRHCVSQMKRAAREETTPVPQVYA